MSHTMIKKWIKERALVDFVSSGWHYMHTDSTCIYAENTVICAFVGMYLSQRDLKMLTGV